MRIYKYRLEISDEIWISRVKLPVGARILCAGNQGAEIYVWALISEAVTETEELIFHVEPTGHHDFDPRNWSYINTVFINGGQYVFHVFQELRD